MELLVGGMEERSPKVGVSEWKSGSLQLLALTLLFIGDSYLRNVIPQFLPFKSKCPGI